MSGWRSELAVRVIFGSRDPRVADSDLKKTDHGNSIRLRVFSNWKGIHRGLYFPLLPLRN